LFELFWLHSSDESVQLCATTGGEANSAIPNLDLLNRVQSGDNSDEVNQMLKTDVIQITPDLLALLTET